MFWNFDGTVLQRVTHPAQESFLGSLDGHRYAADSDQWIDRILALQHLPEPVSPLR